MRGRGGAPGVLNRRYLYIVNRLLNISRCINIVMVVVEMRGVLQHPL